MTQVQQKTHTKIDLAPNQIYVKRPGCPNPIQTLIEGAQDWSFARWEHSERITLYYKGRCVSSLEPYESGGWKETLNNLPRVFTSLADATRHYTCSGQTTCIDEMNREEGLEDWCIRTSFTPETLSLRLTLPSQERKRVERLAALKGDSVEALALQALYAFLPEWESFYQDDTPPAESRVEEALR
jgi:hypothetical protein